MLKKIVIGILCFLILAVTGVGIYIYTLNWNNNKEVVAKRFSQITGLKAVIDGNLKVDLLPKPKFSVDVQRPSVVIPILIPARCVPACPVPFRY